MAGTSLFEIGARYTEAFEVLASLQEQGEIDEMVVADTLNAIECEFNEKAINVGAYILSLESVGDSIRAEVERLNGMLKAVTKRETALRDYLQRELERMEIKKIESKASPFVRIALRKNPEAVVMDDPKAIPDEFVREEMTIVYEKAEIKRALKAGQIVPGAHLESKTRLEVK